ncbi:ABC transporter ATP-binding protein [Natranaerobius trueperi]|uniref:Nitrate/sulfonate/bicarbonate ABC transporter ATP-binding protein n=1 Tax=Natranaerobius trueperi TaxID=759412 RepID=A0A226BV31_9FIRM|nr:ABC transporter ATP-binding protein [Natranaerobius trueperi]OWZ82898.1 nitrate/sulfonate/bicarbonate ABC transporter ATP-binding protein [Natranaerobius trueperi]
MSEKLMIQNAAKYFENVNNRFEVFNDINLQVEPGEFLALLGPSGCGKSTLLNLIAGLENLSQGSIYLGSNQITAPGPDRGVVFQEPALMPWLTVLDNIVFAIKKQYETEGKDCTKNQLKQVALSYLQMVHLSKFKDHYPHKLSGGMKQRVAIARALAMDPKLLLMDEPFGALDEQTRMVLQKELIKVWEKTQKTVIFVTHNIREAIYLADRVVLMGINPGRVIDIFPVDIERPRTSSNERFTKLEEEITDDLSSEIYKVMKEEMGDEYQKNPN